jgi:WD40 repeat protein/serine/threonine protein kinase
MSTTPNPEEAIVDAALEMPAHERAAYLDKACGDDRQLRQLVDALLHAHKKIISSQLVPSRDLIAAPRSDPAPAVAEGAPEKRGPGDPTMLLSVTPLEKPGDHIGRYKLLEQIGEGGFGVVYVAEQREPVKRRVALKIVKLGMDTRQVVARFEAERQALALMDHPNIAKVFDGGATEAGRPYFVMELVRGIKITDYCDQNNLPTVQRLELFVQICRAIQHAHQKGIIHRDIKPSNILVTLHDGVPVPKVIDFGIAKATQQELTEKTVYTQLHQFIGTPAYMSPEQAEMTGLDIDTRSDIYSLGVLLYELLTGETPFDGKKLIGAGLDEIRRIIREQEPPRPSTRISTLTADEQTTVARRRQVELPRLVSLIRGDLDWIVMKCLEKHRGRRYETANGIATEIERFLNNEPVSARPPSRAYRFQKLVRRNKLAFAAVTAIAIAVAAGMTMSLWESTRARASERSALLAGQHENEQRLAAEASARQAKMERARAEASDLMAREQLYSSRINLAYRNWQDCEMDRMEELLKSLIPQPGKEDLRGFEWRYLTNLLHPEARIFNSGAQVRAVALSPDEPVAATAGCDVVPSSVLANSLAISTAPTNQMKITLWDIQSGNSIRTLPGHYGLVNSLAFSPDGKLLASGGMDRSLQIWRVADGERVLNFSDTHDEVSCVAFSPDSKLVALGAGRPRAGFGGDIYTRFTEESHMQSEILLVEAASGKLVRKLEGHTNGVWGLCFSHDGSFLASVGDDAQIKIWDVASGRLKQKCQTTKKSVLCVAVSPDGKTIAAGDIGYLTIWQPATDSLQDCQTGQGQLFSIAFSPDGKSLATGGNDRKIKIWWRPPRSQNGPWIEKDALRSHRNLVSSLAYAPNGRFLITGSWDGSARVWNLEKPIDVDQFGRAGPPHGAPVSADFSADGKVFVEEFSGVHVWDASSRRKIKSLAGPADTMVRVRFSPDGKWLAVGRGDGGICVWNASTWKQQFAIEDQWAVTALAFSPDGKKLITGNRGGDVKCWNPLNGELIRTLPKVMEQIFALAFSPDATTLAVNGGQTNEPAWAIHFWTWPDLNNFQTLAAQGATVISYSPDGRFILLGSGNEGTVQIRDAKTRELVASAKSHTGMIWGSSASPDSKTFATSSWDGSVRLWQAHTGAELFARKMPFGQSFAVAFSPTGKQLVSGALRFAVWQTEKTDDLPERSKFVASWKELPVDLGETLKGELARANSLAWSLATSPDPRIRDGSNAVIQAEKAVALTLGANGVYLDTLGAAYAEAGDFSGADTVEKMAIALASKEDRTTYSLRAVGYKLHKPYHEGEPSGLENCVVATDLAEKAGGRKLSKRWNTPSS